MSSVFVYVGQCGNQIGGEFLGAAGDYAKRRAYKGHVFHSSDGKLKSVHVDTESKVLASTVGKLSPRYVREENVIRGRGGRGNNFACGYYGLEEGDCLLEQAVDAIRKEAERCESFSGIVITHSLAGGTGSGLGARLTVRLRDEFPIEHLLSCVVHPLATGETPLQHYNELLCLAKLYECSDGVVVYSNDAVLRQAQRSSTAAQGRQEKRSLSFASINKHIASSLCGLLFPNDTVTAKSCCSINMEPWEMLRSLCPMPTLNFVTVDQHATREASWTDACSALLHGWHKRDSEKQSHVSFSCCRFFLLWVALFTG